MDKVKLALQLLPVIRVLYQGGVIDIHGGTRPYIQLRETEFRKVFPDVEMDEQRHLVTYINGIEVMAVCNE